MNNETRKASAVLESVDWKEFNTLMTFSQAGDNVIIWNDGSVSEMYSGTYPHPDKCDDILHIYHPCGMGNNDFCYYLDGWTEETEDGNYITSDGRELTLKEALSESIENGDFVDMIEGWKEEALNAIEESGN